HNSQIDLDELIFGGTAFIKPLEQFSASWLMLEEVWMVEIELFHDFKAETRAGCSVWARRFYRHRPKALKPTARAGHIAAHHRSDGCLIGFIVLEWSHSSGLRGLLAG